MHCFDIIMRIVTIWIAVVSHATSSPTDFDGEAEGVNLVREAKPGWVRFCSGEKRFDIFSNQCPAGFFWKPDFKVNENGWDCVCSRGAWRLSNKWCSAEDVPRFVQGDVTCFVPDKNLQGMLYLGDQYSAWDSGEPVLLSSYKSGFTIKGDDFEEKWKLIHGKNGDAGILIVRPRDDWTVEDQNNPDIKLCLRAPIPTFTEEIDGIYIYNVSLFFNKKVNKASQFKLLFTRTCFTWKKDDGKTWYEISGENIDDKNMVIVQKYSNKTATDVCQSCMSTVIPDAPKADVFGKPLKRPEKKTIYDLKNVAILTSEINLQSERLGLYWTNRLLKKDAMDYAKGDFQELEILEKAAVLAYAACNMKYIPKEFYQYFLVMFRKLLSESFQKYAPVSPINSEYYKKILDLLEQCKKRTKPIDFSVDKGCPEKYSKYQDYKFTNESRLPISKFNDYNAEPAKHDYLLEFVWRLKSFLHYQCFPEFKEDSVLHDLIQNQMESLFTEDILLRWYNPSMAFRMYDHIFKTTLDLKTTMSNFEKCVRVVHDVNKFPVWLKRPIDQPSRTQQSLLAKKKRRRRRRAIDDEQDGVEGEISMESEFTDMALENIRQKRIDETSLSIENESEPSTTTMSPLSEDTLTSTSTEIHSTDELNITSFSGENKSSPSSSSGEEIDTTSTNPVAQIQPTTSQEETTSQITTTLLTTSAERVNALSTTGSSEEITTTTQSTLSSPLSSSAENFTFTTLSPIVNVPVESTTVVEEEIRWKREDVDNSDEETTTTTTEPSAGEIMPIIEEPSPTDDESITQSSMRNEYIMINTFTSSENIGSEDSTRSSTLVENESETESVPKKDTAEESTEENQQTLNSTGKTSSSELDSLEALYVDSAEMEEGGRPGAADKVWNKFTVDGVKGFAGACITSMSSFAKESKHSMEECW